MPDISKAREITQVEIVSEFKHIQVRLTETVMVDGETYGARHERFVLSPDMADVAATVAAHYADPESDAAVAAGRQVAAIADAVWSDDVKAAWTAKQDAGAKPRGREAGHAGQDR
ncbi:MAG: hypothetical protein KKB20_04505 [Proteobacteria bacterium]|nr:hypothetical protein [Pseudomonadota bacterium]